MPLKHGSQFFSSFHPYFPAKARDRDFNMNNATAGRDARQFSDLFSRKIFINIYIREQWPRMSIRRELRPLSCDGPTS